LELLNKDQTIDILTSNTVTWRHPINLH